jgi:hypothetical protein
MPRFSEKLLAAGIALPLSLTGHSLEIGKD